MKQQNIEREGFWNNAGVVNEEVTEYLKMTEVSSDENWSIGDEVLTLICC